jgi:hypothetical protein
MKGEFVEPGKYDAESFLMAKSTALLVLCAQAARTTRVPPLLWLMCNAFPVNMGTLTTAGVVLPDWTIPSSLYDVRCLRGAAKMCGGYTDNCALLRLIRHTQMQDFAGIAQYVPEEFGSLSSRAMRAAQSSEIMDSSIYVDLLRQTVPISCAQLDAYAIYRAMLSLARVLP